MFKKENPSLVQARAAVVKYYSNIRDYIDFGKPEFGGEGVSFPMKSFEEVSGLTLLGSGCFANVYDLGDRVLKIVKTNDDSYARFINEGVKTTKDNPFLPKVYFSGVWAGKQVYILEKLSMDGEYDHYVSNDIKSKIRDTIHGVRYNRESNPFIGILNPHLKEIADILVVLNMTNDLHSNNMMW